MREIIKHYFRRVFRGSEVVRESCEYGTLVTYKSGYVELVQVSGERVDCWLAEQKGRIPWHCVGSQGIGRFVTPPMTLEEAKRHVREVAGEVIYVDQKAGHIFYRQSLTARTNLT